MGRRHGRGGSDDGDEWGKSAFWGPDEQAEPPGWPSLPDQPEVTGQWAPMPRRADAPQPPPQSEPYETTGAFALPGDPAFPPAGGAGGFPPGVPEGAGPFETTGAFARPPEWDAPQNQPSGPPDRPGPSTGPFDRSFDGPDTGDFFPVSADRTAVFGGGADGRDTFDGDRTARFDAPPEQGDGTARFDAPYAGPPEPGDVKVAGSPTPAPAPAWANAETGFLDSGWSGDSGHDEPRSRRGRRKRGDDDVLAAPEGAGKGRMALLSVAAVAVVLGGTVAGVSFISSPGDPAACEGTSCAAVQESAGQPAPEVAGPVEEESETVPDEEPVQDEESAAPETPTPTAGSNVSPPRRTASAAPTRTKAQSPSGATQDEPPPDVPVEEVEETPETPRQEVSVLDDAVTDTLPRTERAPTPADTGTPDLPQPQQSQQQPRQPQQLAPGGSVDVEQSISQRPASYKAELTVSNTSARTLQSATVSMPVNGRVVDVDGADWTQDGDLLILDVETPLPAGQSVDVSFTALGKGTKAQNCGLVTGECVVT
ncbi:hypothetical protein [Nonomuraea terrae]|uniref:hypothetical protein n=1 Tax=Nonomuraea terrae TaxID=2530383 RepID=UPI00104314CB|nr:hypothetical protein [Nonomuraea terrae]